MTPLPPIYPQIPHPLRNLHVRPPRFFTPRSSSPPCFSRKNFFLSVFSYTPSPSIFSLIFFHLITNTSSPSFFFPYLSFFLPSSFSSSFFSPLLLIYPSHLSSSFLSKSLSLPFLPPFFFLFFFLHISLFFATNFSLRSSFPCLFLYFSFPKFHKRFQLSGPTTLRTAKRKHRCFHRERAQYAATLNNIPGGSHI